MAEVGLETASREQGDPGMRGPSDGKGSPETMTRITHWIPTKPPRPYWLS